MQLDSQLLVQDQELESKMQVRFDKSEMDDFYNSFEPMDIQSCLDILFEALPLSEAA